MRWLSSATPSWFRHDQRGFVPGPVTRAVRMSIEMSSSKGVVIPSKLGVFGIGCICIHIYIYLYYNIILYYIVLYCIVLNCIILYYIYIYIYIYIILYHIILYYIILYYIILYILYVSVVLDNVSELSLFYDVLWLIIGTVYVYMYIYIHIYIHAYCPYPCRREDPRNHWHKYVRKQADGEFALKSPISDSYLESVIKPIYCISCSSNQTWKVSHE